MDTAFVGDAIGHFEANFRFFPVFFPVIPKFEFETGSNPTASTTAVPGSPEVFLARRKMLAGSGLFAAPR
jgi:hypothetical protein